MTTLIQQTDLLEVRLIENIEVQPARNAVSW
jgi:hypothetical protein